MIKINLIVKFSTKALLLINLQVFQFQFYLNDGTIQINLLTSLLTPNPENLLANGQTSEKKMINCLYTGYIMFLMFNR